MTNSQTLKQKTITLFDFVEGKSVRISREIAKLEGNQDGPNIVFIGGMHGNEPTGVLALNRVMNELKPLQPLLKGNVYALSGNLNALERGERFIVNDLNRVWQQDMVERAKKRDYLPSEIINEVEEQIELWEYIDKLMGTNKGKFYFIDLHTTSGKSVPFITMSDTIMNRSFAKRIPVPVVIGIEEHLHEPLLSYVNDLGFMSMAFEGGQHNDPESVRNHEALIWLSLVNSGVIKKIETPKYKKHYHHLMHTAEGNHKVYAINYRQNIGPKDVFEMVPGYGNFQSIKKDQILATLNFKPVKSPQKGLIFMPLYQKQGNDGFFIIKKIAKFWLGVSFVFRKLSLYRILRFLPGVKPFMETDHIMVVNTQIAKWYSKQILNLMGYRRKNRKDDTTLYIRRKYDFKGPRG